MKKVAILAVGVFLVLVQLASLNAQTKALTINLINNPSVELSTNAKPDGFVNAKTGTNTTAFNYLNTGHTGSHSLQVQMTKRSGGNAKWYFTPVTVLPNTKYTFTDWYQSDVQTHLQVAVTKTTGTTSNITSNNQAKSTTWNQASISFTTPANAKTLTVYHYLNQVGQLTTDDFDIEGAVPVPPTVSLSAPLSGATVANTQVVSANASDANGISNVQFKLDGNNLGNPDTTAPYSVSWNTKTVTNGSHTLTAVATDKTNLSATSSVVSVNVQNAVPPTVSFISPASGSTVSGTTQAVSVNASTDTLGVQFKIDGNNLGAEDTTAPYSVSWNTTQVVNGSHTLSAIARNAAGMTATTTQTVNVQNIVTPPPTSPNLIANPSLETSTSGTVPDSWLSSNWGTNTATFSYLNSGHTGNHGVSTQITSYTNGAANWYYTDVPVTGGKTYKYENWYQSNVDTEVDAEVVNSDGTVQYFWLGAVLANTNWTKFSTTFAVPAGAKSLAIYQILAKVGYINSDDYSLSEYTPLQFNRGLVSITFDDGWTNQYQNALPLLKKYGLGATFYILSGELTDQPDYMTATQVKALQNAGSEIGSHSVTHPDLTTLTQAQITQEMSQSQTTLQNLLGVPVSDFAYPFGAYNAITLATGQQYYQSQRTVNAGYNTKDNFNLTTLKIYEVDSNISQAQVKAWIDGAIAQKTWLVLVYHEVALTPTDPTDALYDTQPSDLDAELSYIKSSGVGVVTVHQAINEILPQL